VAETGSVVEILRDGVRGFNHPQSPKESAIPQGPGRSDTYDRHHFAVESHSRRASSWAGLIAHQLL
jgi:hypothetical protein